MKALTLWQPWASLIALGEKKIETRSWQTTYRGMLAIHASQKMTREMKLLCEREPFASALDRVFAAGDELPLGAIVAVCELRNVLMPARNINGYYLIGNLGSNEFAYITEPELSFGDYTPGRYAWMLKNVCRLQVPVVCRGAQGLWDVSHEIEIEIQKQLRRHDARASD